MSGESAPIITSVAMEFAKMKLVFVMRVGKDPSVSFVGVKLGKCFPNVLA